MPQLKKRRLSAKSADKHELYEMAVQAVDNEAGFIDRLYRRMRGKRAFHLKEDFCGTASLCCEWVKRNRDRTAIGVDFHGPTLDWGRKHRLSKLTDEQRDRITLVQDDVLNVRKPKVDLIAALNFSYYIFKTRDTLREYFKSARTSLRPDGILLLDSYGGSEAQEVLEEKRACEGFTYIWEHADYNPITNETLCHIHFEFPDGSKRRRVFSYDWRLWSLMELRELLTEAGFASVEVHWEGTDRETGEGNGVFRKTTKGEAIESWVAYLVALK